MFLLKGVFSIVNLVLVVCLLISYLAPIVSPESFWFIAFFGLAQPFLFVLNALFFLFWLIQFNLRFIFSLAAIVLGYNQINAFVQLNFKNATINKESESNAFKVMSYNVRLFDLYNWSHNTETRNKIFDLINDESPDILCTQEFFTQDNKEFNTLDTILTFSKLNKYHVEYTTTLKKINHWGIATFTKYPIVRKGQVLFSDTTNNICIYTDVKINDDTVRIYNMHLQSIHFTAADYEFVNKLSNKTLDEESEKLSKDIFKRLKKAFLIRATQADMVAESIQKCTYPIVLCGDFNDTPSSYAYHTILKGLTDSFVESGNGLGRTYIGVFPSFRIDYIMHSKQYASYEFHTGNEPLSDHYPVSCSLSKTH